MKFCTKLLHIVLVLFLLDYFLAFEVDSELLLGILIQGFQEMPEGMDCQVFPLRSLLEMSARNQRKQKLVLGNVILNYEVCYHVVREHIVSIPQCIVSNGIFRTGAWLVMWGDSDETHLLNADWD